MSEIFCLDCEKEVKLPMFNLSQNEDKPVKYKTGYRCANCSKKKDNKRKS